MATQLGRNSGRYVGRISARFYCNSAISQTHSAAQHQVSAASAPPVSKTTAIVAPVIAAAGLVVFFYGTKPSEIRKRAEKRVMKKFNRELNAFDAKLCKSGSDDEKLMMYEREFAALKEFVSARDEEAEKITKHAKVG